MKAIFLTAILLFSFSAQSKPMNISISPDAPEIIMSSFILKTEQGKDILISAPWIRLFLSVGNNIQLADLNVYRIEIDVDAISESGQSYKHVIDAADLAGGAAVAPGDTFSKEIYLSSLPSEETSEGLITVFGWFLDLEGQVVKVKESFTFKTQ